MLNVPSGRVLKVFFFCILFLEILLYNYSNFFRLILFKKSFPGAIAVDCCDGSKIFLSEEASDDLRKYKYRYSFYSLIIYAPNNMQI